MWYDALFDELGSEAMEALSEVEAAKANLRACEKKLVVMLFEKHSIGYYDRQYESDPKTYRRRTRLFRTFGLRRDPKMSDETRAYHRAHYAIRKQKKKEVFTDSSSE